MNIRRWKFEDILKISEMERECFKDPWSYRMLADSLDSDNFIGVLCDDDGDIAGYGGVTVNVDTADIDNIAVAENYRRSGVGSAILEELVKVAAERGAEKVFLEVRVSNSQALLLYLRHGFKGVYARTRYYPDGEDCLVMAKEIV